jgi:hypothetical protein
MFKESKRHSEARSPEGPCSGDYIPDVVASPAGFMIAGSALRRHSRMGSFKLLFALEQLYERVSQQNYLQRVSDERNAHSDLW